MFCRFYYNYYHFEALIMNDSLGDDFGCSYIYSGDIKIPFYVKNKNLYILNKIKTNLEAYSQLITLEIKQHDKK